MDLFEQAISDQLNRYDGFISYAPHITDLEILLDFCYVTGIILESLAPKDALMAMGCVKNELTSEQIIKNLSIDQPESVARLVAFFEMVDGLEMIKKVPDLNE